GRDARGGLARLVAQLDAQDVLGLGHVATGLGEGLLAFHHGRVGLGAQFLDHASGDFRHRILQSIGESRRRQGRRRPNRETTGAAVPRPAGPTTGSPRWVSLLVGLELVDALDLDELLVGLLRHLGHHRVTGRVAGVGRTPGFTVHGAVGYVDDGYDIGSAAR